ncbi:hypothetical protein PAMA_016540 [Pampus argenteus]
MNQQLLKRTVISSAELDFPWSRRVQPHTSILSDDVARAPTGWVAINAAVLVPRHHFTRVPSAPVQLEATVGPNLEQMFEQPAAGVGSKMAREDVDGSSADNTTHIKTELTALRCHRLPLPHKENPAPRTSAGPGNFCAPKKHLDDLSTPGIGCCQLDGNYLPIRAVDGPTMKNGVAVKDQAQSQV